jgi:AraC-like DNA-binding protein
VLKPLATDLPAAHLPEPDVLSLLFDAVRTRGDVFCRTEASGPWGIAFGAGRCHFHYVERGQLVAQCAGAAVTARAGDLLIFCQGAGHSIASAADQPAAPLTQLLAQHLGADHRVLRFGAGQDTHIVCGGFHFNEFGAVNLLRGLPPVLHLTAQDTAPLNWLAVTLGFLAVEVGEPSLGSAKMISSLIELMFVQAVRHWVKRQPDAAGWAAAFSDTVVAKALVLMHEDIAVHWTVEALAQRVGASRATLFERFSRCVGCPPLRYLTDWRMTVARRRLVETAEPLASIATRVGYDEAAFSRAFAREVGLTPSQYRRRHQARA